MHSFILLIFLAFPNINFATGIERLSVAYCVDCVPFHFQDHDGNPQGLIIDYWQLWSKKTGIAVEFIPAPWNDTLNMVGEGAAKAHAGLFYNETRDTYLDYGTPLRKTDTHVFFHQSIPSTTSFRDLSAYRIGVLAGDAVEGFLKQRMTDGYIKGYPDYTVLIEALKTGELKVFAADTPTGLFHLKKAGLLADFSFVSDGPLYRSDWFTAVKEGEQATLDLVNKGMAMITDAEKMDIGRRWIGDTKKNIKDDTLIIAVDRSNAPFSFINAKGRPAGLFVDFWQAWSEKTGRRVRFRASNQQEMLENLKSGEVDIHSGLTFSSKVEKEFLFSKQFYETASRVFHRHNENIPPDIRDIGNKFVGVVSGSSQEALLHNQYPGVRMKAFDTAKDMIGALIDTEVDAVVGEFRRLDELLHDMGLQSDIVARPENLSVKPIHAVLAKSREDFLPIVNNGLDMLSRSELSAIEARWIEKRNDRFFARRMTDAEVGLTREERIWLNKNPVIRSGADHAWAPYDYLDQEGNHQGLSANFIKRIEEILGVSFQPPERLSWEDSLARAQNGQLDILTAVAITPERKKTLVFTKPYMTWHNVIAVPNESAGITSLDDLSGKKVGVVEGYAITEALSRDYPELKIVPQKSIADGLSALSNQRIDAFIESPITIEHYKKEQNIDDISIVAKTPYKLKIAMAVKKDWPILAGVLDKALAKISATERKELAQSAGISETVSFDQTLAHPKELLSTQEMVMLAALVLVIVALILLFVNALRTQKRAFFRSLRGKTVLFISVVFIFIGSATIWLFGIVGERISLKLGTSAAQRHVLWHKEKVLGAVQRELALAKQMAESELLTRWAVDEENPRIAADARKELQKYHDNFMANSYFVGLVKSKHFFYADNKVKDVKLNVVDTLSAEDNDDIWFFKTINDSSPYNLNVDHNIQLGVTNLWVNYAMRSNDMTHGVVGTGIQLSKFINDFIKQDDDRVSAMIIDNNGAIQAHVDPSKIARNVMGEKDKEVSGIWALLSSDDDRALLQRHMRNIKEGVSESETLVVKLEGKENLIAIAYLEPLEWFTLAMIEPGSMVGLDEMASLGLMLAASLLITVVMVIVGQNVLIIRPLHQLTEGAHRMSDGQYDVKLKIAQRDEIGDLSQTFNNMAQTISDYTGTLEDKVAQRTQQLSKEKERAESVSRDLEFLKFAIDRSVDMVFWINLEDARLLYVNLSGSMRLGYSQEELSEMRVPDIDIDFPVDQWPGFVEVLKTGKPQSFESTQRCRSGETFPVEVNARYVSYGDQNRIVAFSRDITQRKKAERQLKEAFAVITSSIQYASRIQRSMLPSEKILEASLAEHFIYWKPRDKVGGDAYWCEHWAGGYLLALGDCTGHGVPGAFVTMIANGALQMALLEIPPGDVAALLQRIHQLIQSVLSQDSEDGESDDGLEMGICFFKPQTNTMIYAGARFSLFYIEGGEVSEIRGDKKGLGYRAIPHDVQFTNQQVDINPERCFYMTTDGLIDQVGGEKRLSFGKRRFKALLKEIDMLPMNERRLKLKQALFEYQGDESRRDDVSVIGFKIK